MNTSLQHSKDRLQKRFLDFLWHQWSIMGVAGQTRVEDERIIDPEALLLATTRFGRYDSRLLDEVIDWLHTNGKRINLHRLRRMQEEWPVADLRVLAAISEGLAAQSILRKWITFSVPVHGEAKPEPLFISSDRMSLPVFHQPDPAFLRHGLLREPIELRHRSRSPDPSRSANLLCSLRALFGVNARAEIFAWLLAHESGHPAAITRDTGYFSKSVQHTLNEMEDSGHIRSRKDGREKIFWLKPSAWDVLITWTKPSGFPQWVDWMPIFSAITIFIDALAEPGLDDSTEQIQSIQLRHTLDAAMPSLAAAGLAESMTASRKLTGCQLINAIHQDIKKLEQTLEASLLSVVQ